MRRLPQERDGVLPIGPLDRDNIGIASYPVTTVAGPQMNTLWDGLFHTFTWLAVLTGLGLLYARVVKARGQVWRSRVLWGWVLFGWGLFNVVEGIANHDAGT